MTLFTTNLHGVLHDHLSRYPNPQSVYVISSYIRKEGMDRMWPIFQNLEKQGTVIRIITTFNRKITDIDSVERLANLNNTKVYIFEPSRVNFHAKSWILTYPNRDMDTLIVGSSNLTGSGVSIAVEWNLLLQRNKHRDASQAIDDSKKAFLWYLSSVFKYTLILWDVDNAQYQDYKRQVQRHLITDQELMEQATPEVQREWEDLNAKIERIMQNEKIKIYPGGGGYVPLPTLPALLGLRTGRNIFLSTELALVPGSTEPSRLRNAIGDWSLIMLAHYDLDLPKNAPPSEELASKFSGIWNRYQERREKIGVGRMPNPAKPYPWELSSASK